MLSTFLSSLFLAFVLAKDAPIKRKDPIINEFRMMSPKLKNIQEENCLSIYACCKWCEKPEVTFSVEVSLHKKDNSLDILNTMQYKHDLNQETMAVNPTACYPLIMQVLLPTGQYEVITRLQGDGVLVLAKTEFTHETCVHGMMLARFNSNFCSALMQF